MFFVIIITFTASMIFENFQITKLIESKHNFHLLPFDSDVNFLQSQFFKKPQMKKFQYC